MAFARTTGEILGYLNTDDTLYPGCLHRVAREIDPARGRYIVFGRCLFTGEGLALRGPRAPRGVPRALRPARRVEARLQHDPAAVDVLAPTVYETCGGFDEAHNHGLDYLQWCRFSKRFWFHRVDELWSTYRMHPVSVTANKTSRSGSTSWSGYSRLHWGPWWRPLRWRCALSYWFHDREQAEQALVRSRRAQGGRALG